MRSSLSSDPLVQSKPLSPHTLLISLSSQTPQGAVTLAYPANKATLTPQESRGRQAVQTGDSLDFSNPYPTLIIPEWPEEKPLLSYDPVNASDVPLLHENGVSAYEKAKNPIHGLRRCCQVFSKTRVTWPLSQLGPSEVMCDRSPWLLWQFGFGDPSTVKPNLETKTSGLWFDDPLENVLQKVIDSPSKKALMPILFTAQVVVTWLDLTPQINPCFGSHPGKRANQAPLHVSLGDILPITNSQISWDIYEAFTLW